MTGTPGSEKVVFLCRVCQNAVQPKTVNRKGKPSQKRMGSTPSASLSSTPLKRAEPWTSREPGAPPSPARYLRAAAARLLRAAVPQGGAGRTGGAATEVRGLCHGQTMR